MAPAQGPMATPWSNRSPAASIDPTNGQCGQVENFLPNEPTELKKIISALRQELARCRKREDAIRAVFIANHEKEQALSQKALDLEVKGLELKFKEAQLNMKSKRMEAERRQREDQKSIIDEHVAEQKKLADAYKESIKQTDFTRGDAIHEEESTSNWAHLAITATASGRTLEKFQIKDTSKFDTYRLPISADAMNRAQVQLLRRHDYYRGWFDCAKVAKAREVVERESYPTKCFPPLDDSSHPLNAFCAGSNVGALFGWSTLCNLHNKPEWDVRLDDKKWSLTEVSLGLELGISDPFWAGVEGGLEHVKKEFQRILVEHEAE